MPTYSVLFKPSADKERQRLPQVVQKRIVRALEKLIPDPRPKGALKLADQENLYRLRIGDYRAIYEIEDEKLIVLVLRVAHRKDVYREL